jgi:diguanylate cyclase (GGDEF)-like protein
MGSAPKPANEAARLAALREYDILDKACWDSFDNITRIAASLTGSPIALISLIDSERQWFLSRQGLEAAETSRDLAFCAHAILDPSQPLVVEDATQDPRFADNELVTGAPDIRFYAGIPLVTSGGPAIGTLCVIDRTPKQISPQMLSALGDLGRMVMTTLDLRRAMLGTRRIALTDSLTGLPNRAAFLEAIGRAIACQCDCGDGFSLLYLDLDGFKRINDELGHEVGDRVLARAAETLRAQVRADDMPARLGGDEFAALLRGVDSSIVARVAERVRVAMELALRQWPLPVTASVGAVLYRATLKDEAEAIAIADATMYDAKKAGRNRVICRTWDGAPAEERVA